MSRALRGGNGRLSPSSSMMGSSTPETRTTKFPRPGFSGLISTLALEPTAFWILPALVLNAPHCLQASIVTTLPPAAFFLAAAGDLAAGFLALVADFFFAGEAPVFLPAADERVVFAMVMLRFLVCYYVVPVLWRVPACEACESPVEVVIVVTCNSFVRACKPWSFPQEIAIPSQMTLQLDLPYLTPDAGSKCVCLD